MLGFATAPAQTYTAGARTAGVGFAGTTLETTPLNARTLSADVSRPFGLAELQTAQVRLAGPLWRTHVALGLHTFGFSAYRELRVRAGLTQRVRPWLDLEVHLEVHTVRITGYGGARALGLTVGGLLRPTSVFQLGFQMRNPNRPTWAGTEPLPRRLAVGLSYHPGGTARVLLDVEKAVRYPASVRGGLELQPVPTLALRAGFTTSPQRFTAGFGIHLSGVQVDAAAVRHPYLGWTPVLSVRITLP